MLIAACFDMFLGAAYRLVRRERHRSVLTHGLWGTAHTWKHFRASLHCNWTYYHNYSFKVPAICIRHAPAQPPSLWPYSEAPPCLPFTFYTLTCGFAFHSLLVVVFILIFSTFSGYVNIRGEQDYLGTHYVRQLIVHYMIRLSLSAGPRG